MIPILPLRHTFALLAAAACCAALPANAQSGGNAEPFQPKTLAIGAQAPDFDLPGVDGRRHKLADFASARLLAVIFTCNHCPEAWAAAPRIQQTADEYRERGLAVVAISGNDPLALRADELGYAPHGDSFEEMKLFAQEEKWTIPYLYDGETQAVSKAYGAVSTPHVFLFDADRKLRYTGRMDEGHRRFGPVEVSQMRAAIDDLLAGREVALPTTRPYGCSTKWTYKRVSVEKDNEAWKKRPVGLESLDAAGAAALRKNAGDRVRLIQFWATTCGPCVAELPDLVETSRRFQNRPFELVTISTDPASDRARVLKLLQARHVTHPRSLEDALKQENRSSNNFQAADGSLDGIADAIDPEWSGALPHSVLLAPGGEILWRHTGQADPVEMRRQIIAALARE